MNRFNRNWNILHTILNIFLLLILIFLILVFLDFIILKDVKTLLECKPVIDDSKEILSISNNKSKSIIGLVANMFNRNTTRFKRYSNNLYSCIYKLNRIDRTNYFNNLLYNILY